MMDDFGPNFSKQVGMYAPQVAFPAFRQVEQTSSASLVDYFQVTTAPSR